MFVSRMAALRHGDGDRFHGVHLQWLFQRLPVGGFDRDGEQAGAECRDEPCAGECRLDRRSSEEAGLTCTATGSRVAVHTGGQRETLHIVAAAVVCGCASS